MSSPCSPAPRNDTGFKGLGGRFDRRKLLYFSAGIAEEIRYTRIDTGQAVDVAARMQSVPFAPQTFDLMQKCLDGSAATAEFRECWQAACAARAWPRTARG
jgi:hypothetical protein